MKENRTASNAVRIAMRYAKLNKESVICTKISYTDGLYEIFLQTPFQVYEFFVDSSNWEVLGINTEPLLALETIFESCDTSDCFSLVA